MKNVIDINIIRTTTPSALNCDESGSPKSCIFGGVSRWRLSQQTLKNAARQYCANELVARGTLTLEDLATRTKRLLGLLIPTLVELGHDSDESIAKVRSALAALDMPVSLVKGEYVAKTLALLGRREIAALAQVIHAQWDQIKAAAPAKADEDGEEEATEPVEVEVEVEETEKPKKGKKGKKKGEPEKEKEKDVPAAVLALLKAVFDGGQALDLALFGRMMTALPGDDHHASVHTAQALSVHAMVTDSDFYKAMDQERPDGATGADMLGVTEFGSATFCQSSHVNFDKLLSNLDGDKELALTALRSYLEAVALALPMGKQSGYASYTPLDFMAVTIRRNAAPRSLLGAFEVPVARRDGEAISKLAVERLTAKAEAIRNAFGDNQEVTYVLNLTEASTEGFGTTRKTLMGLIDSVAGALAEVI